MTTTHATVIDTYTAGPDGYRYATVTFQGVHYTVRQTPKLTTTVWLGSDRITKRDHPGAFHALVGAASAEWERPAVTETTVEQWGPDAVAVTREYDAEAGPTPERAPALAPTVDDDRRALAAGLSFVGMHGGVRTFQVSRGRSSGQRIGRVTRITESLGGGEWVRWAAYREDGSRVGYAEGRLAAGQLLLAEADARDASVC